MEWLVLFKGLAAGLAGGFASGLTGMGGGGVFVPIFYFLFGLPMRNAIGTSLLVVLFSSFSAGISHWRGGRVHHPTALIISVSGLAGAQAGAYIAGISTDAFMKGFFVFLVLAIALKMWVHKPAPCAEEAGSSGTRCEKWKAGVIGFFGGVVSAMGGVGGAVFITPMLHLAAGMPMTYCIGTTLVVVFFNSLSGSIGYYLRGSVDLNPGLLVAAGAVIAAPAGAMLSVRLGQRALRRVFAGLLLFSGVLMLFSP